MTRGRPASTPRDVAGLTDEEWRVVRVARANVLFVGSNGLAQKIVGALRPDFRSPIEEWRPAARLILPPMGSTGTLILQDVGEMPRDDQRRLCDWLEITAGRIRVVSTHPQPLLPLIESGTFAETLYYRLNILCFQVTECEC